MRLLFTRNDRYWLWQGLLLVGAFLLAGCSSFWVAPAPEAPEMRTTATPTPGRSETRPTAAPTWTPMPAETPDHLVLSVSQEAVQFWSNPNEIVGLHWDGETVWAATLGGVARWWPDGRYTLFTAENGLASQAVAAMSCDGDGHIWIGYRDTEVWSEYDGASWHHYPTRQDAVEARYEAMLAAQVAEPLLWSSQIDSDWLWLPRGNGQVQAYDGERWRSYTENHGVTPETWGVTLSQAGRVWAVGQGMATALEGELWWDDHSFFSGISSPDAVTDLAVDGEGAAWITFAGPHEGEGGIARYNYALDRWEGYQHAVNEAIPERVYCVAIESDGTILIGGNGVVAMRPPQRAWRSLSVPGVEVLALARGEGDALWLGSPDGLWKVHLDGTGLQGPMTIPTPLRDNEVRALLVTTQDDLVLVGRRGLSVIRSDGAIERVEHKGLRSGVVDRQGRVWLGGTTGLYRLDSVTLALTLVADLPIDDMAIDLQGLAIVGVDGGVYRWADGVATLVMEDRGQFGSGVRDIEVDSEGAIWLATDAGMISLSDEGTMTRYTGDEELLSSDVRAVAGGGEGIIWGATAKGLARRLPEGRWTRFTVESTGGGLRSMSMRTLYVEPDGTLWMATDAGLSRRSPEADWSYYDLAGIDQIAIDRAGVVWLGSESGLYRLDPGVLVPAGD